MEYSKHKRFRARDPEQERRSNRGEDVSNPCAECGYPQLDHYNGACPADEENDNAE